jgi:hypothetical protein
LAQQPNLDYLTLDYLAEVSLSIMAAQQQRDPSLGYAKEFVDVVRSLVPAWREGSRCRVVTNAGGLNPMGCAEACAAALRELDCTGKKIGIVYGDNVLELLRATREPSGDAFRNLETGAPIGDVLDRLVTANAYLGARPVAEALSTGADIVIAGRVADPSLVVGPAAHHFGWRPEDYTRIAGALVAGHIIECGAQVTGGISTNWLDVPDLEDMGFPFVELFEDGTCIVTKPEASGGCVTMETVKEQMFYEIGDPGNYLSPDATVSLLDITLTDDGPDRVCVAGATGAPPTGSYKVSATYHDGYWAQGTLTIYGRDAILKAKRCGEIVRKRLLRAGFELARYHVECLGSGACSPGMFPEPELIETVLRIAVADPRKEAVDRFSRELAPLITSGPQGVTGFSAGRPRVSPVFGYWPCLISKEAVTPKTETMVV